jgi:hypothetical protein
MAMAGHFPRPHAGDMVQTLTAGDDAPRTPQSSHAEAGPTDPVQVRAGSPESLLAIVPHLLGFVPQASLVVIGTEAPHDRIKVTLRYDLPDPPGAGVSADVISTKRGCSSKRRPTTAPFHWISAARAGCS